MSLFPQVFYSSHGIAESSGTASAYEDTAWFNKPAFATPGYCKIQTRVSFRPYGLKIRVLGIQQDEGETGTCYEITREMIFKIK